MRASELAHEVRDDAVEVKSVVETRLSELHKVPAGDRHFGRENLGLELAFGRIENCGGVRHLSYLARGKTARP
ncbi:MAG: hypothetical protein ACJAYU_004635 [Bradymonadia bacterium]